LALAADAYVINLSHAIVISLPDTLGTVQSRSLHLRIDIAELYGGKPEVIRRSFLVFHDDFPLPRRALPKSNQLPEKTGFL